MNVKVLTIILGTLAFWPLLPWYCRRLYDGSDDSLGLVALITALALAVFARYSQKPTEPPEPTGPSVNWLWLSGLLIGYILLLHQAPHLVLAVVMVLTLWLSLQRYFASMNSSFAFLGLLLLSLPIVSSLNFFFGFPLRWVITHILAVILSAYALSVHMSGTSLTVNGHEMNIDVPCSGVHFLWFSAYLALLLAYIERANFLRILGLLFVSAMCAILGNVFRNLLFSLLCAFGFAAPANDPFVHEGIGAFSFCLTLALIVALTKLTRKPVVLPPSPEFRTIGLARLGSTFTKPMQAFFCLLCVVAASMPLVAARSVDPSLSIKPDPWHDRASRNHLTRIPLSLAEKRFQTHFPGQIAKFSDGKSEIVLRNIYSPTRQLHPAGDCLKGIGYAVSKEYLTKDSTGALWHTLIAEKDRKRLEVKERILDHHGHSWAHVSDWYWAAMLGQTKGPWLSIMKAQTVSGS